MACSTHARDSQACARLLVFALLGVLPLAACTGIQSALDPQGPDAQRIATIAWILFGGAAVIFFAVMALAGYAIFAVPERRGWIASTKLIIGAGVVFPVVALSVLLIYTFGVAGALVGGKDSTPLKIAVTGEMWWWRVHYLDASGHPLLVTANEIHIPVGRPIELSLATADVLHSFWLPNLAGKLDMIPGRVNVLRFTADQAGVSRGQCAEYCGAQHAKMAFYVVAKAPLEFDAWLAAQREPAEVPHTEQHARGRVLFVPHCGACHTVRGTPAAGVLGPDLTHIGSRRSLAAGILPNNVGTLAGWIASSQHLKPENRMPSFDIFTGEELRALAAYLESLQ
ncbi:MAG: cytochrome c oxidase subunit II [Casimicrobiaceae bacterium]